MPPTLSITVHIAMLGWPVVAAALFLVLPARRAVIAGVVAGWLLLPNYIYRFAGFPEYTKAVAATAPVLLAALLFDPRTVLRLRPRLADLPMLAWCLAPAFTVVANGDPAYSALSGVVSQTLTWGVPYVLGRAYFTDWAAARELAIGIVIGGLAYVPLCLLEMRFSPQLHTWVYGFRQHEWTQVVRFGSWRPMVFLQHGIALGLFMAMAALLSLWLWRSGSLRRLAGVPIVVLAGGMLLVAVACRSAFAAALLALGLGVSACVKYLRITLPVAVLIAIPPAYMLARTAGGWSGQALIDAAASISEDRAGSIRTRIESENILWEKARERQWFGWGDSGRSLVFDEDDRQKAIPDGLWIIAAGKHGLVGLAALTASLLIGPWLMFRRVPARHWVHPAVAPAAGIAVIVALYMCDNLLNAMFNPIFIVGAGALVAVARRPAVRPATAPVAARPALVQQP